jgi:hypothetical protein
MAGVSISDISRPFPRRKSAIPAIVLVNGMMGAVIALDTKFRIQVFGLDSNPLTHNSNSLSFVVALIAPRKNLATAIGSFGSS